MPAGISRRSYADCAYLSIIFAMSFWRGVPPMQILPGLCSSCRRRLYYGESAGIAETILIARAGWRSRPSARLCAAKFRAGSAGALKGYKAASRWRQLLKFQGRLFANARRREAGDFSGCNVIIALSRDASRDHHCYFVLLLSGIRRASPSIARPAGMSTKGAIFSPH